MNSTRIAEIRAENHQGDVSHKDIEWLCRKVEKLHAALFRLERWSTPFIEKSPISAETLWREFPAAIESARTILSKSEAR